MKRGMDGIPTKSKNSAQRLPLEGALDPPKNKNEGALKKVPKPDHPYMKVLGWSTTQNWTLFGTQYHTRFIYSGKAADWKKLLSSLDSDTDFVDYLLPFFAATGVVSTGSVKNIFRTNTDYVEGHEYKDAQPSESDIIELLKALYDTESSTKSTLDLPDKFSEGSSNIPKYYDSGFDGLAAFISKYQTLLITEKSAGMPDEDNGDKTEGVALNYGDIKN